MTRARLSSTNVVLAALLALSCAAGLTPLANADGRRTHEREFHDHEFRESEFHDQRFMDSRFNHNHYYPPVGHEFQALPPSPLVAVYGGNRFYFSAGVWYRPFGGRFVAAAPPFGIVIPVLPPYYTQVWVGGLPYYYANNVYYMQRPDGYVVVPQPSGAMVTAPPPPASGVTELGPAGAPISGL